MDYYDKDEIYKSCPNLRYADEKVTSKPTDRYNCIAFACGDSKRWWETFEEYDFYGRKNYWPEGCTREHTVNAWIEMFNSLGYKECTKSDFEPGCTKIAIYELDGEPTHVAIQPSNRNGRWKSKLGPDADIEHDLDDLSGRAYGHPTVFMKKSSRKKR